MLSRPGGWVRLEADRVVGWMLVLIGVIILGLGWYGISNVAYVAQELPYILSGGVGGVFALGLGATLLLSAELRDEWRKLDEECDEIRATRESIVAARSGVDQHSTNGARPGAPVRTRRKLVR